jgi:hypothetical protein
MNFGAMVCEHEDLHVTSLGFESPSPQGFEAFFVVNKESLRLVRWLNA